MSENAKWYVAHTYSGYEDSVAAAIMKAAENRRMQDLILEVNIPLETVVEHTDKGDKIVKHKVFQLDRKNRLTVIDGSLHFLSHPRRALSGICQ